MTIGLPKPSSLPEISQPSEESEAKQEEQPQQTESTETKLPSIDDIIVNHEQRIQSIEAALLRVRGAI